MRKKTNYYQHSCVYIKVLFDNIIIIMNNTNIEQLIKIDLSYRDIENSAIDTISNSIKSTRIKYYF